MFDVSETKVEAEDKKRNRDSQLNRAAGQRRVSRKIERKDGEVQKHKALLQDALEQVKSGEVRLARAEEEAKKSDAAIVGLGGTLLQTEEDQNVRAARDLRETIRALESQVEELNEQLDEALMTQSSDALSRALDQREKDDEDFLAGSLDNKPGRQNSHQTRLDVQKLLARGVAPSGVIGIMNQFGAPG